MRRYNGEGCGNDGILGGTMARGIMVSEHDERARDD